MDNIEDNFIHLTNNAIQKNAQNYGQFEEANQLSFSYFHHYLEREYQKDFYVDILPNIKNIITKSLLSVKRKIVDENSKYCFELLGYDFIIDAEFNSWLIEINTNPCLELSSTLLKMLIPRMLDDAFKLTIDLMFIPQNSKKSNNHLQEYPVNGYFDSENLWLFNYRDKLCNLKNETIGLIQNTIIKSQYLFSIEDKVGIRMVRNEILDKIEKMEKCKTIDQVKNELEEKNVQNTNTEINLERKNSSQNNSFEDQNEKDEKNFNRNVENICKSENLKIYDNVVKECDTNTISPILC